MCHQNLTVKHFQEPSKSIGINWTNCKLHAQLLIIWSGGTVLFLPVRLTEVQLWTDCGQTGLSSHGFCLLGLTEIRALITLYNCGLGSRPQCHRLTVDAQSELSVGTNGALVFSLEANSRLRGMALQRLFSVL